MTQKEYEQEDMRLMGMIQEYNANTAELQSQIQANMQECMRLEAERTMLRMRTNIVIN